MAVNTSPLSTQDERIIAALGHVSVLVPMVGMIAPITIWVTQRERSRDVAFQSLQAIAFQITFILLWVIGFGCYAAFFFLMFFSSFILPVAFQGTDSGPLAGALLGGMFLIPVSIIVLMIVMFFTMIIYGIVAAILTFQGKEFRYAIVGRWVERYMQQAAVHDAPSSQA